MCDPDSVSELDEIRAEVAELRAEVAQLRDEAADTRALAAMADRDAAGVRAAINGIARAQTALIDSRSHSCGLGNHGANTAQPRRSTIC
jgi:cell division protein FtsB